VSLVEVVNTIETHTQRNLTFDGLYRYVCFAFNKWLFKHYDNFENIIMIV